MPTPFEWVTFGLGTAGTVLGLVNGVRQILASRVTLLVKTYPLSVLKPNDVIDTFVCVEVINRGTFPITIKEVTFEPIGYPGARISDSTMRTIDGKRLPHRIEAHDSLQVCFPWKDWYAEITKQYSRVIVETACGRIRHGDFDYWLRKRPANRASTPPDSPAVI